MTTNPLFFRKTAIALTGLFLCLFLIVHLSANCILLLPKELAIPAYNSYSTLLRESPLIKIVAYLLYAAILLHVFYALLVTLRNRKAKPVRYAVNHAGENSSWASRNMGVLGTLILIFIVIHLANFWARIKLGLGEAVPSDPNGNLDVYSVTYELFQNAWFVAFYALMAIPLAWHLHHGLKSGFKTLGFYHQGGLRIIARISLIYAWIMGLGFGIIPIVVFFK
ncbi:succinate dehydrogenase / fumarate reductase cytochrome b subunit [Robiginitalea myxolifaciens]|uniref:Succinate dehydrogenase / fumarate reductase cytochrome b subunit n=1 Tax=Robiginitalea myxolifaciens TaxID=400055 RepID=A0A1I6FWB7_9FLAO|nr:succinate dehydrogenase cytochrome b subunit [Robiginitalea myxolifaciens]SFR34252.1 succinate dehydrogenase / fumarate reductase cytochrome b subunit [Robiginitalea myxolifaciens]